MPLGRNQSRCQARHNPPDKILADNKRNMTHTDTPYFPPVSVDYPFVFNLDEVANYGNAVIAYAKAARGKKGYRQVRKFDENRSENLHSLVADIRGGTYRTGNYILKTIQDARKAREIAKTEDFRDRVAQWMVCNYLVPQLTGGYFSEHSHAAIPGKGIHTALEEAVGYVNKFPYVAKIDIRKFFPNINRWVLKSMCDEIFEADELRTIVQHIIDDAPKTGVPIGNLLSQYLANIYLTPLDRWLESTGTAYVRYMDDLCIFAETADAARRMLREVEWYLQSRLFLSLKSNWQVFPIASRGLDFVGYRIWHGFIMLRKTTLAKFRRASFDIQKSFAKRGYLTESEQSTIWSYLGWLIHCSRTVRETLFGRYYKDLIWASGITVKKKSRLRKYYNLPPKP